MEGPLIGSKVGIRGPYIGSVLILAVEFPAPTGRFDRDGACYASSLRWRCLMPEEKLPESVEYEDGCTCGKCLPCKVREVMRKAEEAARLDSGRHHGG